MARRVRRMNFRSKGAYKRWVAYDAIHNPNFGAHPVDVDVRGRHVKGPTTGTYLEAHRHRYGHHGGKCTPACRSGAIMHRHGRGSTRRG